MKSRLNSYKPTETDAEGYKRSMASAEGQLTRGEYFAAEGTFAMALIAKPRDVMATVGRVHAQIGAGLLMSAAGGLRDLLTDHPELTATTFDSGMLPRRQPVRGSRRQDPQGPGESVVGPRRRRGLSHGLSGPPDRPQGLLDEGLREFAARTPADDTAAQTLLQLVREVWTAPATPEPAESVPAPSKVGLQAATPTPLLRPRHARRACHR